MPNRKDTLLRRLVEEGQKTAAFFRALTDEQLAQSIYLTGPQWHARDVLAHLVTTERYIRRLLADILAGGSGAPEDFSIDAFNAEHTADGQTFSAAELVTRFEAARAEMIALVTGLDETDFDRSGRHPFLGVTKLEEMLKLLYRHTMLHERDVRRALETGQPVPGGG